MTSHERVLAVLTPGRLADRVPLNVFAGWNPEVRSKVEAKHGSIEAFNDQFEIDIMTGVLPRFPFQSEQRAPDSFEEFLDLPISGPPDRDVCSESCDGSLFPTIKSAVARGRAQDRAVFGHAWGVFELSQFLFERNGRPGTEKALLSMAAEPEVASEVYMKLANWSADCVGAAIACGVDAIELSDDWGQQNTMLFSPKLWQELIYPATKLIVDRARISGTPVLIHSDGDVTMVLDGIKDLGVQGLHPVQESAGMDPQEVRNQMGADFCIIGGLDTVSALPSMNPQEVRQEVRRIFAIMQPNGSFIFAGSHMFQDDTDLEVIEAAYDEALRLSKEKSPPGLARRED